MKQSNHLSYCPNFRNHLSYTWTSYIVQDYPEIIVGMLFIGVFGMGSSALVRKIGNALMPWYWMQRKKS